MKRIGICQKCGLEKEVRDHHLHGYGGEHRDEVAPYCYSCDKKAHYKARREGRCTLSSDETKQLSKNSCKRRTIQSKKLSSTTLIPHVQLFEQLDFNSNTYRIGITSCFFAGHGKRILYIGDKI